MDQWPSLPAKSYDRMWRGYKALLAALAVLVVSVNVMASPPKTP